MTTDFQDLADELVKSLNDAIANDNARLIAELTADLAALNIEIEAAGFVPVSTKNDSH